MRPKVRDMVRVDHAGEAAAVNIYKAQQTVFGAVRGKEKITAQLHEMEMGEHVHLDAFNKQLHAHTMAPTAFIGLWGPLSHALGGITALISPEAAHACTEAVEDVIEAHYQEQIDTLEKTGADDELLHMCTKFRTDELEHRDAAIDAGAHKAPAYPVLRALISAGCRAAIGISKRI